MFASQDSTSPSKTTSKASALDPMAFLSGGPRTGLYRCEYQLFLLVQHSIVPRLQWKSILSPSSFTSAMKGGCLSGSGSLCTRCIYSVLVAPAVVLRRTGSLCTRF